MIEKKAEKKSENNLVIFRLDPHHSKLGMSHRLREPDLEILNLRVGAGPTRTGFYQDRILPGQDPASNSEAKARWHWEFSMLYFGQLMCIIINIYMYVYMVI